MAPSLAIARQCVRELEQRFEVELQGVRDAFLQELASLYLVEGQ